MPRPKNKRFTEFKPKVIYFKPQGVPLRKLQEVFLCTDELEAIKLSDVDNLDQKESAKKMKVSQPTFGRILQKAHKKISTAITSGKAIRIEKKFK